jgi:NADH-quinone oxidoreductase subunit F
MVGRKKNKIIHPDDLEAVALSGWQTLQPENKIRIAVGYATCGIAAGADSVYNELEKHITENNLTRRFILTKTGCFGFCKQEPFVNVIIPGKPLVVYDNVLPKDVKKIVEAALRKDIFPEKAFFKIEHWNHITSETDYGKGFNNLPLWNELPYFSKQVKVVMRNAGITNPDSIEEYIAVGGYKSLFRVLKGMTSEEVIETITDAGLRGRGGAGFPTGIKWRNTQKENSETKYLVCNADEGDPGAYMNRNEMESDPHAILEGMIAGAYAVGAKTGFIYIRAEYPLAIERLQRAINQACEFGLLGKNILGSNFSFDIYITRGAGAFVCGEETALIASLEGEAGRPRPRPPYPSVHGLWGLPTNINNVETWCNIPVIIEKGSDWFKSFGSSNNAGTKVFSLVGNVNKVGLAEVELGTPLKTIVCDVGACGIGEKKIKAAQTGGPSGGCIPSYLFDTPVDYDNMKKVGSIMGSGGIVVLDEDSCMVDTAKYFLNFSVDESCGKCVPCREGLKHMHEILERITAGKGKPEDIELLKEMSDTIKITSLCGLGQTAPNPVITTLQYFENEYREHINEKICDAKVCRELTSFYILADKCVGCVLCAKHCPVDAIVGKAKYVHIINQDTCISCSNCFNVCPYDAIVKLSGESVETPEKPIPVKK